MRLASIALLVLLPTMFALRPVPSRPDGLSIGYFGYGSNLAASVREGRRGLRPLSAAAGLVRDERLAFNMLGLSPLEPAFASLVPSPGDECHGAVFQLSPADWLRLLTSEGVPFGGPWGYQVREVAVELYTGESVRAWTLGAGLLSSSIDSTPSERYLSLIRMGAQEMGLTTMWQERLASVRTAPFGSPAERPTEPFERRRGATFV